MVRRADADNPQLPLHDVMQQRYELIRPLVLLQERTASQRAQETDTHPETVGALKRRFEAQGMTREEAQVEAFYANIGKAGN